MICLVVIKYFISSTLAPTLGSRGEFSPIEVEGRGGSSIKNILSPQTTNKCNFKAKLYS